MSISTTLRTAAAGALTLALLVGGATSAFAAPGDALNPQSNGSKGSFFLYDAATGDSADGNTSRVYARNEPLIAAASATDVNAEINPSATHPVAAGYTGVYRFISDKNPIAVAGGTATWKAYALDSASGPQGGTLQPDFTLDSFVNGINSVIGTGGSFWYGVAYTTNNGVTTVGAVYRDINITATTGAYTVGAVEVEGTPPPAKIDTTTALSAPGTAGSGSTITLTATISKASGTGTPSGNVEFKDGATSLGIVASAAGVATLNTNALTVGSHSITAVYAGDTAFNGSTSAASTVVVNNGQAGPDEALLVAGNANGFTASITGTTATITAGAANNGKSVNVFGYSAATFLGQGTISGGAVSVSVATLTAGPHKLAFVDASDAVTILGWVGITISTQGGSATRDLQAQVATSVDGNFKLIAPDNTTPAVIGNPALDAAGQSVSTGTLGAFTVVDDRGLTKKGWDLSTNVAQFVNGSDTIANSALGVKPVITNNTGPGTPLLAAEQVAGSAVYAAKFAELAAGTYSPASDFNADLTFKAPVGSTAGTYTSTLTLTLVSK